MNQGTRTKVIVYMCALFATGALAGGLVGWGLAERKFTPLLPHPDITAMLWNRLNTEVHLTPEQQKQAEPLVQKTGAAMQQMRLNHIEEYQKAREDLHRQIETFLTAEQKTLLADMERKYREETRKKLNLPAEKGEKP